ncbi:MAG: HlyD family efflux transporter periplasmic adaptor subunit [Acutalibacteraceae bacterium]|jgi:hypothetical protein
MSHTLKRIGTLLLALALLAYVGYQVYQVFFSSVETETVYSHSVYNTVDAQGLIIRSETPVTAQKTDGYIYYSVLNGERVAKSGKIAEIYKTESDALAYRQMQELADEIKVLQALDAQGVSGRLDLDMIGQQLSARIRQLTRQSYSPRISDLRGLRAELLGMMNKQQITTGKVTGFTERIQALQSKRADLAANHTGVQASITSPVAGYFVDRVDGFEETLDYDKVDALTVADVTQALSASPQVDQSQYLGKVVGDYQWYLACVVSEEDAVRMPLGATMTVLLPFVTDQSVPVEVVAANPDQNGSVAVVFQSNQMIESLSAVRAETVRIQVEKYEGLKVPKTALVFDENNEAGVFVRVGNAVGWRKTRILYSAADYSICEISSDPGTLKLYDDIIVKGKGLYDGKIIQ